MAMFLQIRTGGLYLMVDALRVHEVLGLEGLVAGAQGHAQWRGQVLNCVDLGDFFRLPHAQPQMAVVYNPARTGDPLVLQVEEVLGLRNLEGRQWGQLPQLPAPIEQFFDAVWLETEHSRQSFRLRYPIDLDTFQRMTPAGLDEEFGHDGVDRVDQ